MSEAELAALATRVLLAAFGLAFALGALIQRTGFCTMGAVADVLSMGDTTRLRMWLLAMGTAIVGFNVMVGLGWLSAARSVYAQPQLLWLSHAVGGLLFGFGMVLASGCGAKTLVRAGAGNLKSLVVLCVMGLAAYATLRGIVAVGRVRLLDQAAIALPAGQDLPSLLGHAFGHSAARLAPWLGLGVGGALVAWALARPEGRQAETLLGGLGVGALVLGMWAVSGLLGHVAEHPLTLEDSFLVTNSRQMESFSFVAPVAYTLDWLMLFSDSSRVLTLGVVSVLGMLAGSAAMALAQRSFRWEGFAGSADTARHLVGALCMGVGGVTAVGCTVGQGLSGISTLALGSVIALAGIVAGAVLGVRWQLWQLER